MPIIVDVPSIQYDDGQLTISLAPPAPVGGRAVRFTVLKRFGGISGLVTKYAASGYNNVSGINVTNSGAGVLSIALNSADLSGQDPGAYAFVVELTDTPRTEVNAGYLLYLPGGPP